MTSRKKRPIGRPATGRNPAINITLPTSDLKALDELAFSRQITRTHLMRELVQSALSREEARRKVQAVKLVARVLEFAEQYPDLWEYIKQTEPDMIGKLRDFFGKTP